MHCGAERDLRDATWTSRADRMKPKREHRVALNKEAVDLLQSLPRTNELIFPSSKGTMLSDMTFGTRSPAPHEGG